VRQQTPGEQHFLIHFEDTPGEHGPNCLREPMIHMVSPQSWRKDFDAVTNFRNCHTAYVQQFERPHRDERSDGMAWAWSAQF
jgi:hypothetical protein